MLTETINLVRRRFSPHLQEDNMHQIYVTTLSKQAVATLVLATAVNTDTLCELTIKYVHRVADVDNFSVRVVNPTRKTLIGKNTTKLWQSDRGWVCVY